MLTPAEIYAIRRASKLPGKHPLHITTRKDFAAAVGISPRTLQGWEQGVRQPSGAAAVLLELLAAKPDILEVLQKK